nr:unnamed protein product [Callosobruchus chinensis]CAH7715387.1 unnamed protein product [Callosobruchus chinensis]CAH7724725.1 unnamed protein product [Callosobruchus chinensis]CAH7726580.1 unnamed protein product [Callosobruchus chinensis]CAH7726582.1 unnamed protein product [Callosobruchus chinensis]
MMNHWNPKEDLCFLRTTGLLLLSNGKKVRLNMLIHLYRMNFDHARN